MTDEEWRARARDMCFHGVDVTWDDIQIDDDAVVRRAESRSVGGGAWVQAWVWIPNDDLDDELPIDLWE